MHYVMDSRHEDGPINVSREAERNPRLMVVLDRDQLSKLFCPGVVVEMYDKVKYGRFKRAYHAEFKTKEERDRVYRVYRTFYEWYLVKGVPHAAGFTFGRLAFMERVCDFFGTL